MFLLDSDAGMICSVSAELLQQLSVAEASLVGQPWHHLLQPDTVETDWSCLQQTLQAGQTVILHGRCPWGAEGPFDCRVTLTPSGHTPAQVHGQLARTAQPHEPFHPGKALQTLEERLPLYLWTSDASGRLTGVSASWQSYTGLSLADAQGGDISDTLHPDDRRAVAQQWAAACRTGQPFEATFRWRRQDGSFRWCHGQAVPVRDSEGAIVAWHGATTDHHDQRQAEERYLQSEARFQKLISDNIIGVLFWDIDGGVLDANDQFLSIVGYSRHDLEHGRMNWRDLTPPEFEEMDNQSRLEMLATGRHVMFEKQYIHRNGSRVDILVGGTAFEGCGNRQGISFVMDITERKQAEREILASEARYQQLYQWERTTRQVVEAIREPMGFDAMRQRLTEMIGQVLGVDRCYLVTFDRERQPQPVRFEYRRHDGLASLGGELPPWEHCPFLRKAAEGDVLFADDIQGGSVPLDCNAVMEAFVQTYDVRGAMAVPILYKDELLGVIGIHSVEPRLWLEQEVNLVRTVCQQAAINIFQAQAQQARNEAEALKDLYRHKYEWEKKTVQTLQHLRASMDLDTLYPTLVDQLGRALDLDRLFIVGFSDGEPQPVRYEYLRDDTVHSLAGMVPAWWECPYFEVCRRQEAIFVPDVRVCPVTTCTWRDWYSERGVVGYAAVPIFYQDEMLCTLVLHAATPRLWSEEERTFLATVSEQLGIALFNAKARLVLEDASKRKSEFLAMMSHELRTPLNAIMGYSRMMEMGLAGPVTVKQEKFLGHVGISSQHLLNLINDLLDVSKIEAGQLELTPEEVPIVPLLQEVQSIVADLASKKRVGVSFDIQAGVDAIHADAARFKQILINLISNAIKFNKPNGEVAVSLYTEAGWLVGAVQDTGIGIPQDKLPNLFKKFYQVDNSSSRKQEGTGLGLALTRDLIEMHGGQITVHSEAGVGSTFVFRIPLGVTADDPPPAETDVLTPPTLLRRQPVPMLRHSSAIRGRSTGL